MDPLALPTIVHRSMDGGCIAASPPIRARARMVLLMAATALVLALSAAPDAQAAFPSHGECALGGGLLVAPPVAAVTCTATAQCTNIGPCTLSGIGVFNGTGLVAGRVSGTYFPPATCGPALNSCVIERPTVVVVPAGTVASVTCAYNTGTIALRPSGQCFIDMD